MIQISIQNKRLRVFVSKNEKINLNEAKRIFRKGDRILNQQEINLVEIELNNSYEIYPRTSIFIDKILKRYNKTAIIIINN
jgi:hypothetical protein